MPILTSEQLGALRSILESEQQKPFMELMRALNMGTTLQPEWRAAASLGVAAGLTTEDARLTPLGEVAANSFREYLLWEERNRHMPAVEELAAEHFDGLDVLEIGSGFGVNLLSLSPRARSVTGVDIEPLFAQLTAPLSAVANLPAPRVEIARASVLPFERGSFDVAIAVGALQYTRIEAAIEEMKRVLRPGGQIILVLGHLRGFIIDHLSAARSPIGLVRHTRDAFTTLTYPWLGRMIAPADAPVHPTEARMAKWMKHAGFRVEKVRTIGNESLYIGRRD